MTMVHSILLSAAAAAAAGCKRKPEEKKAQTPRPVEPIPYQKLASLLPTREGWETQPPRGEISRAGGETVSFARAEHARTVDGKRLSLSLEILDGTYGSSAYAPFAAMAHSGGTMTDPHRTPVKLDGHSGFQEWKPESNGVRVVLLVARRFVITLKGTNITQPVVSEFLRAIDLKKLASFADGDRFHPRP